MSKENNDLLVDDNIIVAIKYKNIITWYQADREIWIMDRYKWNKDFIDKNIAYSEDNADDRFGILVINDKNKKKFIEHLCPFMLGDKKLEVIKNKIKKSSSWWDVHDLFPIAFIDFDSKKLSACYPYPGNIPLERYIPDDWSGEFIDFMRKLDENTLPKNKKYWVINNIDYLEKLSSLS
ncbi:hypothetical protein [Proteus alimentorum]|uniref:hypothetical protein n=1 Tax=Proteus alimentorum TaxID=1973495 RepID=UPI000BFFDBA9|nr:hypothetical protein [Proteus alimentorum]